jgi:uncharacterized protein YndB with AHSA1/START domain
VPHVEATRELVAGRDDVWRFLAEPRNLAEWWPGIGAVEPDRRGFAPGARWTLRGTSAPTLLRRPYAESLLVVREVVPYERLSWHLTRDRLDVVLSLAASGEGRTRATLAVSSPWFVPTSRSLPRRALSRLHALCQTGAEL